MRDGEIVARSLVEPEAFAEIFDRHFQGVLAYARRRVGWAPGEELAAQTFIVAFERRERFDPASGSARPWLLGISANLIRHHLRDERLHREALAKVPLEGDVPSAEDPDRLDALRLRGALAEELASLTEADRETFLLAVLGDLTHEETSRAIGVPAGTVRSRIHRARHALREQLERLEAIRTRDPRTGEETVRDE